MDPVRAVGGTGSALRRPKPPAAAAAVHGCWLDTFLAGPAAGPVCV